MVQLIIINNEMRVEETDISYYTLYNVDNTESVTGTA